MMGQE